MMIAWIIVIAGVGAISIALAVFYLQQYYSPEISVLQARLLQVKLTQEQDLKAHSDKNLPATRFLKSEVYQFQWLGNILERLSYGRYLQKKLRQAGFKMTVDQFILKCIIIPEFLFVTLFYITQAPPFLLASIGLCVGIPVFLDFKIKKRYAKFNQQLPDALAMMNSALRAGHSFQSTVGIVASEMPEPIGGEFKDLINDLNLGIPTQQALLNILENVNIPDMRMFITAISIQREVGGNLTEILNNLSVTIRERYKLKRQISTLTAQARITGYILACAPITLLTILVVFLPDYIMPFINYNMGGFALGKVVLFACLVLQVIGFLIIRKIIDIRI